MLIPENGLPPAHQSWNDVIARFPESDRKKLVDAVSENDLNNVSQDWFFNARREQLPPSWDWFIWLMMAGRGFGKNWSGANWLINQHMTGNAKNSGIVAATAADLRRFCIEGPSGILSLAPNHWRPHHITSKSKLVWPDDTETLLFTSEEPERLRGPNLDKVWCDELGSWRLLDATWEMLMLCMRYGEPQALITTTPRPKAILRDLLKRKGEAGKPVPGKDVAVTTGSTHDNVKNLADRFVKEVITQYKGTKLERQEIYGELLDEFEGSLWSYKTLDACRVVEHPELTRIGVGVDPAVSSEEGANLTGIVVGGVAGSNKHAYLLGDHSLRATPEGWATKAVSLYNQFSADIIVAEKNQGGEMVESTIRTVDPNVNVKLVHASKGKIPRAEPIAALYEQNRIHHVGTFPELEDEMCLFLPGESNLQQLRSGGSSPDRADAMVWLMTELMDGANRMAPSIRQL